MKLEHAFYLVNLFDIAFTVMFWDIESNKLVLNIGLLGFVTVKAMAMFVWYLGWRWKEKQYIMKGVFE